MLGFPTVWFEVHAQGRGGQTETGSRDEPDAYTYEMLVAMGAMHAIGYIAEGKQLVATHNDHEGLLKYSKNVFYAMKEPLRSECYEELGLVNDATNHVNRAKFDTVFVPVCMQKAERIAGQYEKEIEGLADIALGKMKGGYASLSEDEVSTYWRSTNVAIID